MANANHYAFKTPDGVTLVVDYTCDGYAITDMEVPPGTKEVLIGLDCMSLMLPGGISREQALMKGTAKSFPDVETLTVGRRVNKIKIPNSLFPNVRHVKSLSKDFLDDVPFLAKEMRNGARKVLNAFCRRDGETLDLSGTHQVESNAFAGCGKVRLTGTENIRNCWWDAFPDGMLVEEKGCNALMAGTILVKAKPGAEEVRVPGYATLVLPYAFDAGGADVKALDLRYAMLNVASEMLYNIPASVETVKLSIPDDGQKLLQAAIHAGRNDKAGLKYIEAGSMGRYRSFQGVLYDYQEKELRCCPCGREGHVDVAPWAERIANYAFFSSRATSVSLPDGLKKIDNCAFLNCGIEDITIPKSVEFVGGFNFQKTKIIHVPSGKPIKGLLEACTWTGRPEDDTMEPEPYTVIDMAGFKFAMPRLVRLYDGTGGLGEKWDLGAVYGWQPLARCAYQQSASERVMQETALMQLRLHPDDGDAETVIKENAAEMARRRVESGDAKGLCEILEIARLNAEELQSLLKIAQENKDAAMAAYILKETQGCGQEEMPTL